MLGENEEPYFLDYASKLRSSFSVARLVAIEASKIQQYVSTIAFIDENAVDPSPAVTAREALRVAELLSYDSSFVKFITENSKYLLSILQLLDSNVILG